MTVGKRRLAYFLRIDLQVALRILVALCGVFLLFIGHTSLVSRRRPVQIGRWAAPVSAMSLQEKMYPDLDDTCIRRAALTKTTLPSLGKRSGHIVLYNFVRALQKITCTQSVTFVTHGEVTYLHNLAILAERWQTILEVAEQLDEGVFCVVYRRNVDGDLAFIKIYKKRFFLISMLREGPISVSVFTPGYDVTAALDVILDLRRCHPQVKDHVTFHLFFPEKHRPSRIPTPESLLELENVQRNTSLKMLCSRGRPQPTSATTGTYRHKHNLKYPINVARNIARKMSQTYFELVADIELYPSRSAISAFFELLKRPDASNTANPRVYVLPVFELRKGVMIPDDVASLKTMLSNKTAYPFHAFVCRSCHRIPNYKKWLAEDPHNFTSDGPTKLSMVQSRSRPSWRSPRSPRSSRRSEDDARGPPRDGTHVTSVVKRTWPYEKWEPVFIGTRREPEFQEGLSWEGKSDKMAQMYILCVKDYEFHILSNVFLVHRPGVKFLRKRGHLIHQSHRETSTIGADISSAPIGLRRAKHGEGVNNENKSLIFFLDKSRVDKSDQGGRSPLTTRPPRVAALRQSDASIMQWKYLHYTLGTDIINKYGTRPGCHL